MKGRSQSAGEVRAAGEAGGGTKWRVGGGARPEE